MATGSLQVNRDIILATKKQHLKQLKKSTPMDAVLALAQMQNRPRGLLNYSSDLDAITIIAQVTRHEIYDPITSALHCLVNGADAITFFTDHSIYHNDLDDMLMLARAMPDVPVLHQNYPMDLYDVMAARASDASGMVIYSSLIEPQEVRNLVSMAQRWKMSTIVQVGNAEELAHALTLSPHVLAFGDNLSSNIRATVDDLNVVHDDLPQYVKVCLMHTIRSIDDLITAVEAKIDAVIIDETLLKNERSAADVREIVHDAVRSRQMS